MSRVIIVGGCRSGKSWLAREYRRRGVPEYCADPLSQVKDPDGRVIYLPEHLDFSGNDGPSPWIIENWLTMRGPWVIEGHAMARVLRRWVNGKNWALGINLYMPCDRIIVLHGTRPECGKLLPGQLSLNKGVFTVWNQIAHHFTEITEERGKPE